MVIAPGRICRSCHYLCDGTHGFSLGERLAMRKEELKAQITQQGMPTLETRSYAGHNLKQATPVALWSDGATRISLPPASVP